MSPREGRQAEAELAAWSDRQGHLKYFLLLQRSSLSALQQSRGRSAGGCLGAAGWRSFVLQVRLGSIRKDGGGYRRLAQSHVIDRYYKHINRHDVDEKNSGHYYGHTRQAEVSGIRNMHRRDATR
eukprot:scaffold18570_cov71-Phaeocystis_antarctica.AAC.1